MWCDKGEIGMPWTAFEEIIHIFFHSTSPENGAPIAHLSVIPRNQSLEELRPTCIGG